MSDTGSTQSFIVVFKADATAEQIKQYRDKIQNPNEIGGTITSELGIINGFAVTIPQNNIGKLTELASPDSPVDYIEEDGIVTTQG